MKRMRRRSPSAVAVSAGLLFAAVVTAPCRAELNIPDPRIRAAVQKAVAFLKSDFSKQRGGKKALAALGLLKGGEPATIPEIQEVIKEVQSEIRDGKYEGRATAEIVYELGVILTLLVDADADRYRGEIQAITDFLISLQGPKGDWDYPNKRTVGDTSMSQYGMLGLWAAERAGIDVPYDVYAKCAAWHTRTQMGGGFAYHPGTNDGADGGRPSLSLTAAGVSSLLIARMYLRPNAGPGPWEQNPSARPKSQSGNEQAKPAGPKFPFLEKVDLDAEPKKKTSPGTVASFDGAIAGGLGWLNSNFRDRTTNPHRIYYYYTLERMAALANIHTIAGRDWFQVCADALMQTQESNGSFKTHAGETVGTALAIMFLTKSSAKTLGRAAPDPVGAGLLAGGKGLPTDLSKVQVKDGEIVKKEVTGPLDDLLTQLGGNTQEVPVQAVQEAIIKKVTIGDRNELIGQTDKLLELADHPEPDIRRTAIWALGRGGELRSLSVVMKALQDPNIDIVIEARNALCWISRKPLGFGLPETPLEGVDEDAPQAERDAAIEKWHSQVVEQWTDWYLSVRPYDERDDILDVTAKRDDSR